MGPRRRDPLRLRLPSWVVSAECASFPLLHHWRVMPRVAPAALGPDQERDVERQFEAWGGCEAVRERFRARSLAPASIVVFLECFPGDLRAWLGAQRAAGDDALRAALRMVERELLDATSFMNARGLLHFDAHPSSEVTSRLLGLSALGSRLVVVAPEASALLLEPR